MLRDKVIEVATPEDAARELAKLPGWAVKEVALGSLPNPPDGGWTAEALWSVELPAMRITLQYVGLPGFEQEARVLTQQGVESFKREIQRCSGRTTRIVRRAFFLATQGHEVVLAMLNEGGVGYARDLLAGFGGSSLPTLTVVTARRAKDLMQIPDSTVHVFWDHDCEPPLGE